MKVVVQPAAGPRPFLAVAHPEVHVLRDQSPGQGGAEREITLELVQRRAHDSRPAAAVEAELLNKKGPGEKESRDVTSTQQQSFRSF